MNVRYDVEIDQVFCGKIDCSTLDEEEISKLVFFSSFFITFLCGG